MTLYFNRVHNYSQNCISLPYGPMKLNYNNVTKMLKYQNTKILKSGCL